MLQIRGRNLGATPIALVLLPNASSTNREGDSAGAQHGVALTLPCVATKQPAAPERQWLRGLRGTRLTLDLMTDALFDARSREAGFPAKVDATSFLSFCVHFPSAKRSPRKKTKCEKMSFYFSPEEKNQTFVF